MNDQDAGLLSERGEEGEGEPSPAGIPPYRVQLPPIFEGPLDLLLYLVERQQLDITAISLAQVAEQYLAYLHLLLEWERTQGRTLDPVPLAAFAAMAARLLWIKSRALLPRPEPIPGSEEAEEDPAEALARQLREYKMFKEAAAKLAERGEALHSYVRLAPPPDLPPRLETLEVTLADLVGAVARALAEKEEPPTPLPLEPLRITVAEKMDLIQRLLAEGGSVRFRDLLARAASRVEIIVSFLAVLELLKRKAVLVQQERLFGEIMILPADEAAP